MSERIKDEVAIIRKEVTITAEAEVVKPEKSEVVEVETVEEVELEVVEELDTSKPYCPRCTDNTSIMGLGEIEATSEWKTMRAECMSCGNGFKVKLWHDSDKWEFVE